MTLRYFETKDAKFLLGLNDHKIQHDFFEPVNFEDIDILVLETTRNSINTIDFKYHEKLYDHAVKENPLIHVYDVDLGGISNVESASFDLTEIATPLLGLALAYNSGEKLWSGEDMPRRDFIKSVLGSCVGIIESTYTLVGIVSNLSQQLIDDNNPLAPNIFELGDNYVSMGTNLIPTPAFGFRDAIAAKKICEYLVPKHRISSDEKVTVAIQYGGAHAGIKTKIQHPLLYKIPLWIYHDLLKYDADANILNQVRRITGKGNENIVYENFRLFNDTSWF